MLVAGRLPAVTFEKKRMDLQFFSGEIVQRASGGPMMTIRGVHYDVLVDEYDSNMFDCIWFERTKDGKKEVHYCPFYADELVKAAEMV